MNFDKLFKYADFIDGKGHKIAANAIDMAFKDSKGVYDNAIRSLAAFTLMLESDGLHAEADLLDILLHVPGIMKSAELAEADGKYDYEAHRKDTIFNALIHEHAKTDPDLQNMRGGGHPLLTRYSPDYPGVMMQRVSEGVYQDLLSKKVYDFNAGFISDTGIRYYGGSIAHQTPDVPTLLDSNYQLDSRKLTSRPQ